MLDTFKYFREFMSKNQIQMSNHHFNKIISNFEFIQVEKLDDINFMQKFDDDIIIIDSYTFEITGNYIIMCFHKKLVIIPESNLYMIKDFFMINKNSKTYIISKKLQKNLIEFIDPSLQNLAYDQRNEQFSFFLSEIDNFSNNFNVENDEINKLWLIIRRSIAGYLIKKSYINIRIDKINNYKDFFSAHQKIKNYDKDEFIILRSLGTGSLSSIELAYEIEEEKLYAIKFYNYDDKEKLFEREINNYKKVHHPFLPAYYGTANIWDNQSIVIEFVDGIILSRMNELNISNHQKIKIIFEILITFEYLHLNHFVHRDIKPNNIIIDNNCHPIIIDFDRMIELSDDDQEVESYTELASSYKSMDTGSFTISQKSDIYSLGLVIYNIMSGNFTHFEFEIHRPKIKFNNIINRKYPKLKDFCEQCFQRDKDKRPSISELVESFYIEYFSKIPYQISEIDTIKSLKYKYQEDFFIYRFLLAEFDNSNAMISLANLYFNGIMVNKDYSKAKKYYELTIDLINRAIKCLDYQTKKCMQSNYSHALFKLGECCEKGYGIRMDYIKAKHYYDQSAKLDNSYALLKLGDFYQKGYGVEINYYYALRYYELSAKLNNLYAFFKLGELYENGYGIRMDYYKARCYYELSAKQNNSYALLKLGDFYQYGYGVKIDYIKALELYELSAKLNNSDAFFKLGELYENGYGIRMDYYKARCYYEQSAKQNNSYALLKLGEFYQYGIDIEIEYTQAKQYYERSAKLNNSFALLKLGDFYQYGFHVITNYAIAKYYYELSANLNNSYALLEIGYMYKFGIGVEKNLLRSKSYFEISSELKNSYALLELGKLYENGLGVEQNYSKAKKYFEESSYLMNSDAFYKLGYLYEKGLGVNQNYLKAKSYYYYSAQLNNQKALYYLGYLYSTGTLFDFNLKNAIYFYEKCIQNEQKPIKIPISMHNSIIYKNMRDYYYIYLSKNCLGLIYLLYYNDIEKATCCIKEAAFAEYPFGQNNYGLINLFFLSKTENARYMFEKASKKFFALAAYNIGYLCEKNDGIKESIEYYKKASDNEDKPLCFHGNITDDKRLEISKTFIICLTNLKLTHYYLSNSDDKTSKKYFVKSLAKLNNSSYNFNFKFSNNGNKIFSYLQNFILNFPSFNLLGQPDLKLPKNEMENWKNEKSNYSLKEEKKSSNKNNNLKDFKIKNINGPLSIKMNQMIFNDAGELFNYIIENKDLRSSFINEIADIISIMQQILYTKPYSILFGRAFIKGTESRKMQELMSRDINQSFYEGFAL